MWAGLIIIVTLLAAMVVFGLFLERRKFTTFILPDLLILGVLLGPAC